MLCMSTSHLKDLKTKGGICATVLSLLVLTSAAYADTQSKEFLPSGKLSLSLRKHLTDAVVEQLEQDGRLPGPGPIVAGQERSVRVSSGNGGVWLAPVQVRYRNLSNKYCRLAVLDETSRRTMLVPLPITALNDTCSKINRQLIVNANGTPASDVVQSVQIHSNRADHEISEALVYLADPLSESGYCYSAQASRELTPENMRSVSSANAALKQARARLGIPTFRCER
jgi:hypothetical protein